MHATVVTIEGIIGSGKTTLCRALSQISEGRWDVLEEPVAENPYLEKFYQDMPRWALEMQIHLLWRRFDLHQRAVWGDGPVLMDRSIYGDTCFARLHRAAGNIDELGIETYLGLWRSMSRFLRYPDVVVFLDVAPVVALRRVTERARGCETGLTVEYLEALDHQYGILMDEMEHYTTVLRVPWEASWSEDAVSSLLYRLNILREDDTRRYLKGTGRL